MVLEGKDCIMMDGVSLRIPIFVLVLGLGFVTWREGGMVYQ